MVVLGIELHMVDRASSRSVLGTGFPSSLRLTACYSFDGHNERVALKDQFNAQAAVSTWATIHSVGLRESGAVVLVSIQRLDTPVEVVHPCLSGDPGFPGFFSE